ncbi:MAG: hypothetical protein GVY18_10550 [Bacteroidetes bacterium]|jgi:hypothetical protein|nr:hypothetical protein [Bacteroidota bacterium]
MEGTSARASIELYGSTLRYAALVRHGARYRLLDLGHRDFDTDLVDAIRHGADADHWQALTSTLSDVFGASPASRLTVTLHPPAAHSFFTVLPADMSSNDRAQHLRQEAGVLMQADTPRPLRLTADAVYSEVRDDARVEWLHVLALAEDVQERIDQLVDALPFTNVRLMLSTHAIATMIERIVRREGVADRRGPHTLAVGWYPSHLEYVLCREGRWLFGRHVTEPTPTDAAYYAAALLERLQVDAADVGRLFVYGDTEATASFEPLATALRLPAEPMRPTLLIHVDADAVDLRVDATTMTPCIGAAL